jgi:four helix bundle protein
MQNAECRRQNDNTKPRRLAVASSDLRQRTKQYALRVIRMAESLPRSYAAEVLGKQALRSGTSVGAHYREACRARSRAEFISKMEVGLQELDESTYWFELLVESGIVPEKKMSALCAEGGELTAIFASSVNTAKKRR